MQSKTVNKKGKLYTVGARKRHGDWVGYWSASSGTSENVSRSFRTQEEAIRWAEIALDDKINSQESL
jgi:hypothetical protein